MATKSATVVIEREIGLHAHPASMFVQTVPKFEADISVRGTGGEMEVDAKGNIAALSLGVGPDGEIVITADGNGDEQAVERLVELVRNNFDLDTQATTRTCGRFDTQQRSGRDE